MFDPNLFQMCCGSSFQTGSFNTEHCMLSKSHPAAKTKIQVLELDLCLCTGVALGCLGSAAGGLYNGVSVFTVPQATPQHLAGRLCLSGCEEVGVPRQARSFRIELQSVPAPSCLNSLPSWFQVHTSLAVVLTLLGDSWLCGVADSVQAAGTASPLFPLWVGGHWVLIQF